MPLTLRGPYNEVDIQALLDTGFDEHLKLDAWVAEHLGLTPTSVRAVELADGTVHEIPVGTVDVFVKNEWVPVTAFFAPGGTLIGLKMLLNHEVRLEIRPGGSIEVNPLAQDESDKL